VGGRARSRDRGDAAGRQWDPDALEAIAVAARAGVLRFGPGDPWLIASVLSGGVLLGNTSSPFAAVQ
jgi:hypothetical protein